VPGGFQFELPAFGWRSPGFASFDVIVGQVHALLNANRSVAQARALPLDREGIAAWVDRENAERCRRNGWHEFYDDSPPPPTAASHTNEWPLWARLMAAQKQPGEVGVGDTIKRVIGNDRSEDFKAWYKNTFNRNCGCCQRQAQMNQKYRY
jgi:hypothetical protein